ncbi:MAG: hypothetical protein HN531_04920 [Opitutae bacterium]|jgi:hypothetical protein|nr:hypothetical protein [Opitutae bacterium]
MAEYTEEQKTKRISHFRRIIKYRIWFGWIFAFVGVSLFAVGLRGDQINWIVVMNGALFSGYGLFMVRQAKRALDKLSETSTQSSSSG